MNGPLLFHVSVALCVSLAMALESMQLPALAVAAYAILVALNKTSNIAEAVFYAIAGAFTAGSVIIAILNLDSGRYFVTIVILTGLAAAWAWTLLRSQKA